MHFTWDEAKNKHNIVKHGIDFRDVVDMFKHPLLMGWINEKIMAKTAGWPSVG